MRRLPKKVQNKKRGSYQSHKKNDKPTNKGGKIIREIKQGKNNG